MRPFITIALWGLRHRPASGPGSEAGLPGGQDTGFAGLPSRSRRSIFSFGDALSEAGRCTGPSSLGTPTVTQSTSGTWSPGGCPDSAQYSTGTAADTGVREGEATDSTEGALGPGWGSRTGHQVVRTLGHTQVLLPQQGLRSLKWSPCVFSFFFPVSALLSNWGSLLPSWGRPAWGSSWKLSFSKASSCLLMRRCRAAGSSTRCWPGSWERTEVFFSTISTTQLYICVNLYIKD